MFVFMLSVSMVQVFMVLWLVCLMCQVIFERPPPLQVQQRVINNKKSTEKKGNPLDFHRQRGYFFCRLCSLDQGIWTKFMLFMNGNFHFIWHKGHKGTIFDLMHKVLLLTAVRHISNQIGCQTFENNKKNNENPLNTNSGSRN